MDIKNKLSYFTKTEIILWCSSVFAIITSFCIFDRENFLTLTASLIGVTSLIFAAKGNPIAQVLMIAFSILYSIISLSFSYYGEMITYMGMTLPMAIISLISWIRNPFEGDKSVVKIEKLSVKEILFMWVLTIIVTVIFYFILSALNTANIIPSTISVTTSFVAAYFTFRRSSYYALGYAANDMVLIVLWTIAAFKDISYISVVVCFIAFLFNDLYGFISWKSMEKIQSKATPKQ